MEVTLSTGDNGVTVVGNLVDCENLGDTYRLTFQNGESTTVSGEILGVTSYYKIHSPSNIESENLAIEITEVSETIPHLPLADGCSIDGGEWEYNNNYMDIGEVNQDDSTVLLRNSNLIVRDDAVASDDNVSKFKINEGDGGFERDKNVDGKSYAATFNSAWTSAPIEGDIARITAYEESRQFKSELHPTEETCDRVDWAF